MFTKAITRRPCASMVDGITTADLGPPDPDRALVQHVAYCEALAACGLSVTVLPALPDHPDGTFVEDTAIMTPRGVIFTRPGAASRRGEVATIAAAFAAEGRPAQVLDEGFVDGGDIMTVGSHAFIGLSARTDRVGAERLLGLLGTEGLTGSLVETGAMLHLKSGVNYLAGRDLLMTAAFADEPAFASFNRLIVDPAECYAANAVWLNGTVLVAAGFPATRQLLEAAGYPTLTVDASEFEKLDGGLSCLSLRYA